MAKFTYNDKVHLIMDPVTIYEIIGIHEENGRCRYDLMSLTPDMMTHNNIQEIQLVDASL